MIDTVYTIGVYGSTEETFFEKLVQYKMDVFCDIRKRRGVRGSKYTYANSLRLQKKLNELGINYLYIPELAPSSEIRKLQHINDKKNSVAKKDRTSLGYAFKTEYDKQILQPFSFQNLIHVLEKLHAKNVVFFCVEENPQACHRSLVSEKLQTDYNIHIKHL